MLPYSAPCLVDIGHQVKPQSMRSLWKNFALFPCEGYVSVLVWFDVETIIQYSQEVPR